MIRRFNERDAQECSKLFIECIEKSLDYKGKNKEFMILMSQPDKIIEKSNKCEMFVYEDKKRIIGTGVLDNGEIRTMFVLPELQRKGIGTKILNYLINLAREKGYKKTFLKSSPVAEGFYKKNNFNKIKDDYSYDFHTIEMELGLMKK